MAELRWTLDAREDLVEVYEFIAQDSPEHAEDFTAALAQAGTRIAEFPQMGRVVPERGDETLREVIFRGYRIIYKITDSDIVGIIAFAHGARDVGRLLDSRRT
jgi:plasmid stabilization system protein ParE